ncbi:MAG: HlyD family efflux transporter periplasmic adaptor subunit [Planctomycetes bacterium]|nr:HlyD family efflux transporter periplasmic adaptor subunit [Planctomycetota bacterium]
MVRTLVVLALLGGVGFVFYAWASSGPEEKITKSNERKPDRATGVDDTGGPRKEPDSAGDSDAPRVSSGRVRVVRVARDDYLTEPLTIPEARVNIIRSQVVGAARQGQILVLGKEIPPDGRRQKPRSSREGEGDAVVPVDVPFLAIEITAEEAKRPGVKAYRTADQKSWRRWDKLDPVDPGKLKVLSEKRSFELIWPRMSVEEGELIGLIDPSVARNDTQIKIAKLSASEAEWRASGKTKDEALKRYESLLKAAQLAPGSVSPEELRGAKLTWERYIEDENAKLHAINVAREELQQALTLLSLHEIRAKISGEVKEINKYLGEAVREQDQVLLIQNPYYLRVEGFVEVQQAKKLAKGMSIVVEPIHPEGPGKVFRSHRDTINAVAVSRGAEPVIVSASDDATIRIWSVKKGRNAQTGKTTWDGKELWQVEHPSPVRSVACTGPAAKKDLCLSGTADGVGRIWDLDDLKKPPVELKDVHRGGINAVAFSADGTRCATGGEDRVLCLWDTETGKALSQKEAHGGAITSLSFTPANVLVSAGRDRTMRTWSIDRGKLVLEDEGGQLAGNVEQLGLFHRARPGKDGKPDAQTLVLIDQGRQLSVRSLEDRQQQGIILSSSETVNFTTFALFSPDGRTVLTTGADNRLQLWRNPVFTTHGRAAELRQYIWRDSPTTCAAFAPQAPFVVTGTRDRNVVLWGMPAEDELREPEANATIINVGNFQENSTKPVRVIADVFTPTPGLMPNGTATMVVYPK